MRAFNIILFLAVSTMASSIESKDPSQLGRQACDDKAYRRCEEQSTTCKKAAEDKFRKDIDKLCGTAHDQKWYECFQSQTTKLYKECDDEAQTCVVSAPMVCMI